LRGVKGLPRRPLRRFKAHAIVIVLKGKGFYEDELGRKLELSAGDVVWVLPDFGQSYGAIPGTTWEEYYVEFSGAAFDQLLRVGLIDPLSAVFHGVDQEWISSALSFASRPKNKSCAGALVDLGVWFEILMRLLSQTLIRTDRDWIVKAKSLIEAHLSNPGVVQLVAKELGFTNEGFRKKFLRQAGVSPAKYAAERRLDEAAGMIARTPLPPAIIASTLGYCDAFHLTRQFSKRFGMPPSKYRASLQEGLKRVEGQDIA